MILDAQSPVSPETLLSLKQEIFSSLHVALPGIIESFDAETLTVSVRPALRRRAGLDRQPIPVPILQEVPVFQPAFSDPQMKLSVKPGDMCLLIFADCNIDGWYDSGSPTLPMTDRKHDWSDAFAFVGFHCR